MSKMTLRFEIIGTTLYHGEQEIDTFDSEFAAADMAIRFAQDSDSLYSITYPKCRRFRQEGA